jgi:predicted AlkP superfamily pyrophosphatase or phosphodiesterase
VDLAPGASPGSHGYLAGDPDMDAILLAWGYGIRPGVTLERIQNVDVAPTVAALLGLKMKGVVGRELREILK